MRLLRLPSNIRPYRYVNVVAALLIVAAGLFMHSGLAKAAGGCTAPATDYGQVDFSSTAGNSVSITSPGTYYIWSRMAAPDTTNNTFMLDVDGANCFTFGGSSTVPVYAAGDSTVFTGTNTAAYNNQNGQNNSNWINTGCSGAQTSCGTPVRIAVNITSGELSADNNNVHLTMYGNAPGVIVDRLIFTQESNCVPDNTAANNYGDNCAAIDTTPPTVTVNSVNGNDVSASPNPGPSVTSPVTIGVSASDDVQVAKVEIYLDGATTPTATDISPAYTFSGLNLSPGAHTVISKAYDTSDNMTTSAKAYFVVSDVTPPTVSITSPTDGSTQSGTIAVGATANDNVKVTNTELYVDGALKAADNTPPFSFSLDTTTLSNASHALVVKAYDAAGNTTSSSTVNITVDNATPPTDTSPPVVTIKAPLANAVIADRAYVLAPVITDASGIKQVVFQIDGVTKSTDTSAPFTYTFDTTTLSTGVHTIGVKATDNSTAQNTNPTFITVTVRVTSIVDVDRNCKVNFTDINSILPRVGTTGTNLGAQDVNNDGKINFTDVNAVQPHVGDIPC